MANDAAAAPTAPAPGDAAALPEGYRINEYNIERPLGGGGFGITYLARDSNLQLPVAIKEYFPSDLVSRGANQKVEVRTSSAEHRETYDWGLERFLDEARALATFRHPNIVRVLRYFRENGTAYIVMEYESGLPLKRWVPQNAPLSQRSLLSIIYPLLDGLEAVHKTGFLHRDIKPDNIYVRGDGTPVLLDFGAARRVSADQDMTNIVSPGFAPFEQYHSQGNQGPWTDIYSLGAVMYWMTTGKKPTEAASRVKHDTMPPPSTLADAAVYGAAMLDAIEWAMHPDEGRRPQTVALFRAAIQGSEKTDSRTVDVDLNVDRQGMTAAGYAPSVPGMFASGTTGSGKRNLLCTVMSLGMAGSSARSNDIATVKVQFNRLIAKALLGVPQETRISVDTPEGAAICFMGDPEEALKSAMLLRDLVNQRYGALLTARIGLHMGPVRVIATEPGKTSVIGDGINVSQRVMDFAQGNQVLVSRSYYEVMSRIGDESTTLFEYLGQYEDKHGRAHDLYSVGQRAGNTRREGPSTGYTQTLPVKSQRPLEPDEVHEVELELARHIGPLARILVQKAQPRSATIQALRETLAALIQETKAREAFLAGNKGHGHSTGSRRSGSGKGSSSSRSAITSSQFSTLPGTHSSPLGSPVAERSQPRSQPISQSSHPSGTSPFNLPAAEMAAVEQALSRFIGPMARMLIRKEAGRTSSYKEFIEAVAANIDQPTQRGEFMQALKRALPRRPQ